MEDVEEFPVVLVVLYPFKQIQQAAMEVVPQVGRVGQNIVLQVGADLVEDMLEQGVEQVFFILEVPVQRAAGYACVLCDFVQRGATNAPVVKGVQCCEQQVFPGFQRFGFGFSHDCGAPVWLIWIVFLTWFACCPSRLRMEYDSEYTFGLAVTEAVWRAG